MVQLSYPNKGLSINRVTPQELLLLRNISIETFRQTFEQQNTEENMQFYLNNNLNAEQLLSEINTPGTEFYFAYAEEELAAYLKLNFPDKQHDSEPKELLEIERIYVLKGFQGLSIGKLLLDFTKQLAVNSHLKGIWLGVWEHNLKAISFYKKNGFVKTGSHVFKLGDDEQTDEIMELKLM